MTESLSCLEKEELIELLEEREWRRSRLKLFGYYPDEGKFRRELYKKHIEFFEAGREYRERCFMAANRIGKTEGAGGYETALHCTGLYPTWWNGKVFTKPVDFWAAGKTNETTRDIVQFKLLGKVVYVDGKKTVSGTELIPGKLIGKISWKQGVKDLIDTVAIKHSSSSDSNEKWSDLGFKSYKQGRGSFEGTEKDGIWLDEEAPPDVYGECVIRTATTNGTIYTTYTPLEGMSRMVMQFLPNGMPKVA